MYDVCIIGGGINGVSTAFQCSQKNFKTILFEQKSLANGASSKTSKLAHGGLRYLENLEFGLVKESLQERNRLVAEYPNMVKPLPFIFPVYSTFNMIKMWLGLKLYDILAIGSSMPGSKRASKQDVAHMLPWLKTDNTTCIFQYYDALMYDDEIVFEIANKARDNSVEIYTNEKVVDYIEHISHVHVVTNKRDIKCKALINVTGAWNSKMTSPSKGVHLITDKLKSQTATILINPKDNRVFFTIPYKNNTIIGTTDDLYNGDPNNISVEKADREYIINAINQFSKEDITIEDIIDEYVGLRPLARSDEEAGKISRDFTIKHTGRTFSMVGGKYTTHRAMCEVLTDKVGAFLRASSSIG